jgi:hypothetical protein
MTRRAVLAVSLVLSTTAGCAATRSVDSGVHAAAPPNLIGAPGAQGGAVPSTHSLLAELEDYVEPGGIYDTANTWLDLETALLEVSEP